MPARLLVAALLLLGSAIAPCGPAVAAEVSLTASSKEPPDRYRSNVLVIVRIAAAPGERNDVTVLPQPGAGKTEPDEVLIRDAGAPLTAGPGCRAQDGGVRCGDPGECVSFVVAELGDEDDRFSAGPVGNCREASSLEVDGGPGADDLRAGDGNAELSGGPGDDALTGGPEPDRLHGGDGADALAGGDGEDLLVGDDRIPAPDRLDGGADGYGPIGDLVSYGDRTAPVIVDLSDSGPDGEAGEGDVLTGVESVDGGGGDDRLTAISAGQEGSTLHGGAGDDTLDGGARGDFVNGDEGGDTLAGAGGEDQLFAEPSDGAIDAGAGDDTVTLTTTSLSARQPTGPAPPLTCGSGDDLLNGPVRAQRIPGDCEAVQGRTLRTGHARVRGGSLRLPARYSGFERGGDILVTIRLADGRRVGAARTTLQSLRRSRARLRIEVPRRLRRRLGPVVDLSATLTTSRTNGYGRRYREPSVRYRLTLTR